MPTPRSAISTTIDPSAVRVVLMTTCESGGEKLVALSSSSASRWTRSDAARPATVAVGGVCTTIRWYCSTSDTAARSTSTIGTGGDVALGQVGAREDQQVLAVAPHAGGEVVELEEVGQLVGVLLVALQLLDQLQLALDQRLAAAREVDEHRADAGLQGGLVGGEPDRLPVHRVERAGHLADLVAAGERHRVDRDVRGRRPARMLSTASGSRRSATSSAEVRSTRSDRIRARATSTAIVMPISRPSIRITELMPARLLACSSAAVLAADQLVAQQVGRAVGGGARAVVGGVPLVGREGDRLARRAWRGSPP